MSPALAIAGAWACVSPLLCVWGWQEEMSGSSSSIFVVCLCPVCLMEMLSRQGLAWVLGELTAVV